MRNITILIPTYNESQNLERLMVELDKLSKGEIKSVREDENLQTSNLRDYNWEFLFVNDGSRDNSLELLRNYRENDSRVNIVNLSRNFGKENAMLAGMDYAKGDAVIIIDADLQDPLEVIPEMLHWWEKGYDDVYGKRKTRGRESWIRKKLSLLYYTLLQKTTKIEILQNVGDFRLLDKRVVANICKLRETQRYTKGLFSWVGYKKKEVLFDRASREGGVSSFNLKSLFNLAIEGITSFTTSPLRIASASGIIISVLSIIYIIWIIIKTLVWGDPVQGFPTLICVILFMGGIQLLSIGIIGEYIARIFNETKNRPVYIVESYNEQRL